MNINWDIVWASVVGNIIFTLSYASIIGLIHVIAASVKASH